jgi:hypothetical protein
LACRKIKIVFIRSSRVTGQDQVATQDILP